MVLRMIGPLSLCAACARFDERTGACAAFPQGIPIEITRKLYDHRYPYPGDHGIMFQLSPTRDQILKSFDIATGHVIQKFDPNHDQIGRFSTTNTPSSTSSTPDESDYTGGYDSGHYPTSRTSGGARTSKDLFLLPTHPGPGKGVPPETATQRDAKIRAAKNPPDSMVKENLARLAASNRAGDDLRGSSKARAVRTQKLLAEFGDGDTCPCVWCGCTLTADSMSQDKIYTLHEGGRYNMQNILPSCIHCNQSLGAKGE